jgi:hypothetical protein
MHKCYVATDVCRLLRLGARDSNGMAKVSVLLWQYANLRKVITSDVGVCVDLDQHGRCAVAQRRDINPGMCRLRST